MLSCKLLALISFVLLTAFPRVSNAQKVAWDSTYRPEIYNPQLDQYRIFKHSKKDIVFIGNSLIHWTNWNELLHKTNIRNRGIPGDITYGLIDRLDEALSGKPQKIFILIGINDISRNIPDEVILRNYERIIKNIKSQSPTTKIYFQTLLPTNSTFQKLANHYRNEHIVLINKGLKQLCDQEKITLIDLYSGFVDRDKNLKKEYSYDGVHLTALGYEKWASILNNGSYLTSK